MTLLPLFFAGAAGIKRDVLDAFDSLSTSGGPRKVTDIDDALFLVLDFFLGQALEAQRALREAFYTLDENGSNSLSWDEFRTLGAHVGLHCHRNGAQKPFTEDELLAVFKVAKKPGHATLREKLLPPFKGPSSCWRTRTGPEWLCW